VHHDEHEHEESPVTSQQYGEPERGRAAGGALPARLQPVVTEALDPLGFDLEQLDVQQAGRRKVVKVVVDSDAGVGLDEVAEATRLVSSALDDADDVLAGPYTLEVTSPGVDRPLTRPRHWQRNRFRLVRLRRPDGAELTARIGTADDTGVQLLVDGTVRRFSYQDVQRAVVEVEFRQPPASELAQLDTSGDETSGDADAADGGRGTGNRGTGNKEESR
jgi:ribosome maturation factor RimP